MNRTGLTLSAVAATLFSLPAAAMLLGLPAAATASAATAPADSTPGITTPAVSTPAQTTCDWAPADGTGHPGFPRSSTGNGDVTHSGWVAGDSGPAPAAGVAPDADGNWRQVSTAGLAGPSDPARSAGSPCDWASAYHVGEGHSVTMLSSTERGRVSYAAWEGGMHGGDFGYGISTNFGGRWHQVRTISLPWEYITGVTVDPFHAEHAYAVYDEDSSRFMHAHGWFRHGNDWFRHGMRRCDCGHVFETWDAGRTWSSIAGDLPLIAAGVPLVVEDGRLALATDEGVFTAFEHRGGHTRWFHLGWGLPYAVDDLTVGSDHCIYAATHGRGTWRFRL